MPNRELECDLTMRNVSLNEIRRLFRFLFYRETAMWSNTIEIHVCLYLYLCMHIYVRATRSISIQTEYCIYVEEKKIQNKNRNIQIGC